MIIVGKRRILMVHTIQMDQYFQRLQQYQKVQLLLLHQQFLELDLVGKELLLQQLVFQPLGAEQAGPKTGQVSIISLKRLKSSLSASKIHIFMFFVKKLRL